MLVLSLIIVIVIYLTCNGRRNKRYRLPPGPRKIPILGNLLQLGSKPHLTLSNWSKTYGNYYTIYLAHKPAIVVNEKIVMKQLLGTLASTGRYMPPLFKSITQGLYGIGGSQGAIWLEQKNFCVQAMKEFGMDTGARLDHLILEQVSDLCCQIEKEQIEQGQVVLYRMLKLCSSKVLWRLITGERNEQILADVASTVEKLIEGLTRSIKSGLLFLPWLKYLFPSTSGYNGITQAIIQLQNYIQQSVDHHLSTRTKHSVARDVIDAYIDKVSSCHAPASSFSGENGKRHVFGSLMALQIAGGEGIGTTLNWMLFYVAAHPKVQKKLHEEIDDNIGLYREPNLGDHAGMPYLSAVMLETFRYSNLVPAGIAHELLEDTIFEEYVLPKGLLLMPNIYQVHNDKDIWTDPHNFRPERFLAKVGNPKLRDFVIPFLIGKRTCPGDQTAKNVIFLTAVKLFQRFSFSTLPGVAVDEYLEPDHKLGLTIKKLGLIATLRN